MFVTALLLLLFRQATAQCGDFKFATYYGDHMVLQRSPVKAVLWGYAQNINDEVKIEMDNQRTYTDAFEDDNGDVIWHVHLDQVGEPGPYVINVTSNGCSIFLDDVLFGDVWMCAGQGNMAFTLSNIDNPQPELEDVVNYPDVRTMTSSRVYSSVPENDVNSMKQWGRPTEATIRDFSAVCWLFGRNINKKYNHPIGLIVSAWTGTTIEAWSPPEANEKCFPGGPPDGTGQNEASALWNAMIHPFLRMPIFGAIWHQGESNIYKPETYGCSIVEMVNGWRNKWVEETNEEVNAHFPFGQVQLAPKDNIPYETGFPDVRWQQSYEQGYTPNKWMFNVFMAVAMDLPDFYTQPSDQPRYKRQVADRLAYAAYHVAYADQSEGIFQGPFPDTITRVGDTIEIAYDTYPLDVRTQGTNDNFELCCGVAEDTFCDTGDWDLTTIFGFTDDTVILNIPCSSNDYVTGVRYAWRESPCPLELCAVYSLQNSLPAPPFVLSRYIPLMTPVKV